MDLETIRGNNRSHVCVAKFFSEELIVFKWISESNRGKEREGEGRGAIVVPSLIASSMSAFGCLPVWCNYNFSFLLL